MYQEGPSVERSQQGWRRKPTAVLYVPGRRVVGRGALATDVESEKAPADRATCG
jgi:hypothetical protein